MNNLNLEKITQFSWAKLATYLKLKMLRYILFVGWYSLGIAYPSRIKGILLAKKDHGSLTNRHLFF